MFQKKAPMTEAQNLQRKIVTARSTLLLVIIFSVVNIVLTIADSGSYFLFSASVPLYLVIIPMLLTGNLYPEMTDEILQSYGLTEPLPDTVLYVCIAIAAIIIALYALFYFLSKKNPNWLYGALVFIVIDTLFLLSIFDPTTDILDIVFHVWIIVELVLAVIAIKKLAKIPTPLTADGQPADPYTVDPSEIPADPTLNSTDNYNLNGEDDTKQ